MSRYENAPTVNDFSVEGSWIDIGLLADGTQLTRVELAQWTIAQGPDAERQDSDALAPEIIAVVRTKHANITVEQGKARPQLNLDRLGADVLYSTDLRRVPGGDRVRHVRRAGLAADTLNAGNDR